MAKHVIISLGHEHIIYSSIYSFLVLIITGMKEFSESIFLVPVLDSLILFFSFFGGYGEGVCKTVR